jgi:hypothetical protein
VSRSNPLDLTRVRLFENSFDPPRRWNKVHFDSNKISPHLEPVPKRPAEFSFEKR